MSRAGRRGRRFRGDRCTRARPSVDERGSRGRLACRSAAFAFEVSDLGLLELDRFAVHRFDGGRQVVAPALPSPLRSSRSKIRHKAENIRGEAAEETLRVRQREALAEDTAARARAAQAEADVKAAQATGLQQQAAAHRSEAATSRDQLNEQWDRAEKLDPAAPTDETPSSTHKEPQNR
jgi:hypothetical protein